jgi:hypothetical protein
MAKGTIEIMADPDAAKVFHRGWTGTLEVGTEGRAEKVHAICKYKYRLRSGETRVVFTYDEYLPIVKLGNLC